MLFRVLRPLRAAALAPLCLCAAATAPAADPAAGYPSRPIRIVDKLNREVTRVLRLPDTEQRLNALEVEAAPTTPAELDKFIAGQVAAAIALARKAGIKPE